MMDFHHIMMLIHHKLYDSYKLYYCRNENKSMDIVIIMMITIMKYKYLYHAIAGPVETLTMARAISLTGHCWSGDHYHAKDDGDQQFEQFDKTKA